MLANLAWESQRGYFISVKEGCSSLFRKCTNTIRFFPIFGLVAIWLSESSCGFEFYRNFGDTNSGDSESVTDTDMNADSDTDTDTNTDADSDTTDTDTDFVTDTNTDANTGAWTGDDFETLTSIEELWTAEYWALSDGTTPMYYATAGESRISLIGGSVKISDARFTIGMVGGEAAADTTATTTPGGELDISEGTIITVVISAAADIEEGADTDELGGNNLIVYIDNNTTNSENGLWGADGRIINLELADIAADLETTNPLTLTATVPDGVGSTDSFLQVRTESGGSITIDSIAID